MSHIISPGVHFLRDPRTKVYNFEPYLRYITQPKDFNYATVPSFTPPSKDNYLAELAKNNNCQFTGSTSSTSSALSQFYLLVSNFKPITLDTLPVEFAGDLSTFTRMVKAPAAVELIPKENGTTSINYLSFEPKDMPDQTIMSQQGVIMENFFTKPPKDYELMLLANKHLLPADNNPGDQSTHDHYAYCQYGNVLLRSQLDCYNPNLPKKSFDIKTRATVAIRMNAAEYYDFINYRLHRTHGRWNSFSREYYDMLRSSFLKYNFQVRIGDMDGLFIAFHNTNEIFGFQYTSREEMDAVLFGSSSMGDQVFNITLQLFQTVLDQVHKSFPDQRLQLVFNTVSNRMNIFALSEGCDSEDKIVEGLQNNNVQSLLQKQWVLEVDRFINGIHINQSEVPVLTSERDVLDIGYQLYECPVEKMDVAGFQSILKRLRKPRKSGQMFSVSFFQRFFSPNDDDDDLGRPIVPPM